MTNGTTRPYDEGEVLSGTQHRRRWAPEIDQRPGWFAHHDEADPHRALRYRSPHEFSAQTREPLSGFQGAKPEAASFDLRPGGFVAILLRDLHIHETHRSWTSSRVDHLSQAAW